MPRTNPSVEDVADQLSRTVSALRRRVRASAGDESLAYPLQLVLKRLDAEGPATTADLARAETITPQSAGALVAQLEEDGLVTRKDDAQDGRRRLVSLTAKGRKLIAGRRAQTNGWLAEQLGSRLDAGELRVLAEATAILRKLLEERNP